MFRQSSSDSNMGLRARMGRTVKSNSVGGGGSAASCTDADPDYIMQLVADIRQFAEVLLRLKEAFGGHDEHEEGLQQIVQERLGDLLRALKIVIAKHPTLNSVDILSSAGTVIARVKGVNFKEVNEENKSHIFGEIYSSIDTLAFTFGNVVSDFLMGDVDSGSGLGQPQTRRSRSFENLSVDSGGSIHEKDDVTGPLRVEEVDRTLLSNDGGVEAALLYAKTWSKYTKDLLAWVEKRLNLEIETAKGLAKMAETIKALASQQDYMPFKEVYISAFKNDIEYSQMLLQTAAALQANKFIQPLQSRKNELDKLRKEMKEQWQKELKKTQEADSAVRKARLLQSQKQEEHEKARSMACRAEEEAAVGGGKQLEKKRRMEEETLQKAKEAKAQYKSCIADMELRRLDMANAKSDILTRIRELVFQCDLTLKAVTVNWFQMQQSQAVSLPVSNQALCESAKLYEPGQRYSDFVRSLPKHRPRLESLEAQGLANTGALLAKRSVSSTHSSHGNLSQVSITSSDFHSADEVESPRAAKAGERRRGGSGDVHTSRMPAPLRAWSSGSQGGGMCSDSESAGGSSESRSMDSPTASPGDFKRRLPRTPSTGTMSSADDLDERELPSPSDNGLGEMVTETASSPGPFRNTQMSKAAQTHRLRKLRAPSKCRECDSLVVFHGAECEECSLACHKKCLETLAIQCGHKKLQGRLHLFGVDFSQAARSNPDGIPFIIKKCTSEIENRALTIKGIYRVNGAKSRVEKLCQAFENGKDLVELSDLQPHDISNVLKLYLRQLPEPLILFRYYNDFISLAKESQNIIVEEVDAARSRPPGDPAPVSMELNRVLFKIRDLLRQLPPTHYKTLQFLIEHLHKVAEKADENKMTASNLGIIFGPTLIKPRQLDAEVSLSSLVDYPYQALIVELLIRHYRKIFDSPLSPVSITPPVGDGFLMFPKVVELRLSAEEKEQRLNRHSKSMVDIKEQSAKVYKRHSSIIPSSQLVEEVKEAKPKLDVIEQAPAVEEGSQKCNGLPPAVPEVHKSTLILNRPYLSTTRVQLRPPRAKPVSRPISMPVERLLGPVQPGDRNLRNRDRDHSPAIHEVSEVDSPASRTSTPAGSYRGSYISTQTLRRTWDRQYKHYDITPRTAKIMAAIPREPNAGGSVNLAPLSMPSTGAGTVFTSTVYAMPTQPEGISGKEGDEGKRNQTSSVIRPARTLRPPPETFYKPPASFRSKPIAESLPVAEVRLAAEEPGDDSLDLEATLTQPSSQPQSPGSEPDDRGPSEVRPVYHRLRPRRLQEFEHREAHFV